MRSLAGFALYVQVVSFVYSPQHEKALARASVPLVAENTRAWGRKIAPEMSPRPAAEDRRASTDKAAVVLRQARLLWCRRRGPTTCFRVCQNWHPHIPQTLRIQILGLKFGHNGYKFWCISYVKALSARST